MKVGVLFGKVLMSVFFMFLAEGGLGDDLRKSPMPARAGCERVLTNIVVTIPAMTVLEQSFGCLSTTSRDDGAKTQGQIRVRALFATNYIERIDLQKMDERVAKEADAYFVLGLDIEKSAIERVRRFNPQIRVCDVSNDCAKGNDPYFWMNGMTLEQIRHHALKIVSGGKEFWPMCGRDYPLLTRARSTILVTHPALVSAGEGVPVETLFCPVEKCRTRESRESILAKARAKKVNRVFALSGGDVAVSKLVAEELAAKLVVLDLDDPCSVSEKIELETMRGWLERQERASVVR